MSINVESERCALDIIEKLRELGYNFSKCRPYLTTVFSDYLYQGIWDWTTEFEEAPFNLFIIQEDEYDQHDTHSYEWDDMLCATSGHYVFKARR